MGDKDSILNVIKFKEIKFINLQFTDIFGKLKNVSIPADLIHNILDGKVMFDGSSVEGFARVEESDMYLRPDFSTFRELPKECDVARIICDVYKSKEEPFEGCPRGVLKRVLKKAKDLGYELYVGPEVEFFLFESSYDKNNLKTHDSAGYFDLSPADKGEGARKEICSVLQRMGFEIEKSHHEVAPGQHEVIFKYGEALNTADNVSTFKSVVRGVAKDHGLHATFMPKPFFGKNGTCMHLHMSLYRDGKNVFYDSESRDMSDIVHFFMGGLLKYARSYTAITNPTVNSYKRLVPGYEAPTFIVWAMGDRSPLIRVPLNWEDSPRIELRSPDPTSNHYLAFAVILFFGLMGIEKEIVFPQKNFSNCSERLPASLGEALDEMERCDFMRECLGDHVFNVFLSAKRREWDEYIKQVHKWELDKYFEY